MPGFPRRVITGVRTSDKQSLDERAERTVAEYLRMHGREAIFSSAEQIAEATGTSDATVVRTAKVARLLRAARAALAPGPPARPVLGAA
jgi:RpiR-like protein